MQLYHEAINHGEDLRVVETELTLADVNPAMAGLRDLAAETRARAHEEARAHGKDLGRQPHPLSLRSGRSARGMLPPYGPGIVHASWRRERPLCLLAAAALELKRWSTPR
jgi:hypothetical protein